MKGRKRLPECKTRSCWRERNPERQLCPNCETRLTDNLKWLATHLPSLEDGKLNRINKNRDMNGNGGNGYSATPPLRETIYDLLYERDEHGLDGVQPTLQAFATCLGIQWMHITPLADLAKRILDTETGHTNYLLSTATPVYAEQIRILVKQCSRILDQGHAINLGTCPNTDCNTPLTADATATTVKCHGCKNTWNINYLRSIMSQRILESDYTGTMRQIIDLLAQSTGQIVNANTFKSWVHRGQLKPAGGTNGHPTYRIADAYRLLLGLQQAGQTADSVWQLLSTKQKAE